MERLPERPMSLRGGRKKGRGRGEGGKEKSAKAGKSPLFSLPSYPLPHSKPATQATHENLSYSLFGVLVKRLRRG